MSTEQELLNKIDTLHSELKQEPYGRYEFGGISKPDGYRYSSFANQLLDAVQELYNEYHPEYMSPTAWSNLAHTCDKEVSYVEYAHDQAIKPRAAKVRQRELESRMHQANQQIELDLFELFAKINERKLK